MKISSEKYRVTRVFLQEKLSGRKVAGIALSISGLGLLLNVESSGDWYAIMLALSAAMDGHAAGFCRYCPSAKRLKGC